MELKDIYPPKGHVQRLYCTNDSDWLDLTYTTYAETISGIKIEIIGLPVLTCPTCLQTYLPDHSRFAIIRLHEEAMKQGVSLFRVPRQKIEQRYKFGKVEFDYDADDYRYIPGLKRPEDDGFLTPVFFKENVLSKYDTLPGYRLAFASTTYGDIRFGDGEHVAFGLNRNGKVIMWLGDIDKLPISEQQYLLSENLPSDHSIGSEFYDAQIEAKFTNLTPIAASIAARSAFLEKVVERYGKSISHLDAETTDLVLELKRPIINTDKECHHAADALNKIHVEAIDNSIIKSILSDLSASADGGSLKQLEKFIEVSTGLDASEAMCPFYVLYDVRVAYSHLVSNQKKQDLLASARERMSLANDAGFLDIYDAVVDGLEASYTAWKKVL